MKHLIAVLALLLLAACSEPPDLSTPEGRWEHGRRQAAIAGLLANPVPAPITYSPAPVFVLNPWRM